ncbi:aspartyl/asparaginyl beta-hydroxylase domain-containing protein [Oceanospirillum sediminis]|uniref:Aspartyl/asparaginyl beta-hydroxylase domain-containing protein n=1 Tax=Oceanospirillum sediminis TaxID=2760088 RepID=A0A839IM31_9GAMM|nr:aspartyl/asparaginyl beta-hydroxylase domain-containing protein [Oceanospirillum sediminis]MBB1485527.1 aspartyl/asparaginyl beta-hydroxylase domain-containing protein [Oceanospirillum sediminis]
MSRFLQLPLVFDITQLNRDLATLTDKLWHSHINQQAHDGGWSALPLRSVGGSIEQIAVKETDQSLYQDTEYLTHTPYFQQILSQFSCPLVSVRLMKLKAGEEIREHTDLDLGYESGAVRLHIPITTHPDILFHIDQQPIHFGSGECWYMNADLPHRVINPTDTDRVHLVIDCLVNDWIEALFSRAGYQSIKVQHKYGDPTINDDNVLQVIAELERMDTDAGRKIAAKLKSIHQSNAQAV